MIDGHRYKEGDKLTKWLVIELIMDEGASKSLSPDAQLVPPPELDIQIGDHVYRNARLIDEWVVVVVVVPEHAGYEQLRLIDFRFNMVTDCAQNEDGSDASLSTYSAHYVHDGSPASLPWPKQEWDK